ncbi:MFS transporter [Streptomyces zhihengii]|uniref:MFS transporter n=1 Tax=Streptomyces zhihengii TaxID=1818004 RepID=UPI0033B545DC
MSLTSSDPRRWKALAFISMAQLMVTLDSTIVNIALPSAQADLGISDGNRQWVVTAYALAFGGLLLFGGRIADLWGRKKAFIVGLVGFAAASALGGLAGNQVLLLSSRAAQGAFGALLAPAALSLLSVMFTESKERAKAFGVFGAITGGGGAVGLLLGGALTEWLNWRWTFFVNIPFAVVAALGAWFVIREPERRSERYPLDIPGVVLSTLGLVALVYGFSSAESHGWADTVTIGSLAGSVALLILFCLVESKVKMPMLPLRVVTERNRGGVYLSLALAIVGLFGIFLFVTYFLQVVQGYSAIRTGFAFMPMVIAFIVGSTQIGTRLMTRVRPRLLMAPGFALSAVAMLLLTRLEVDTAYTAVVFPAMLLLGLGMGTAFMAAMSLTTHGVRPQDAGIASAMANTSQQVGGAVGTALLNTIAASATATYLASHRAAEPGAEAALRARALVDGYTQAIWWAVAIETGAALVAWFLINAGRPGEASGDMNADGTAGSAKADLSVVLH